MSRAKKKRDKYPEPKHVRVSPERAEALHRILGLTFEGVEIRADHDLVGDRIEIDSKMRTLKDSHAWLDDFTARASSAVTRALIVAGGEIELPTPDNGRRRTIRLQQGSTIDPL